MPGTKTCPPRQTYGPQTNQRLVLSSCTEVYSVIHDSGQVSLEHLLLSWSPSLSLSHLVTTSIQSAGQHVACQHRNANLSTTTNLPLSKFTVDPLALRAEKSAYFEVESGRVRIETQTCLPRQTCGPQTNRRLIWHPVTTLFKSVGQ